LPEWVSPPADAGYATSTIDHTWDYLNQACRHALRQQRIRRNPVQDVLLPEARPAKDRKTLTIEQARAILFDAIPDDRNPAMWLTGLMCGLRPGELAGLRWPFVEIDGEEPAIEIAERAPEVGQKYVGQARPKTKRSRRRIGLHPLLVAAIQRHREDMKMLGLYDPEASCSVPGTGHRSCSGTCDETSSTFASGPGWVQTGQHMSCATRLCRT
jgi:integrase